MIDIKKADNDVSEMYTYLYQVANDTVKKYSEPLDKIVKELTKNIDTLSTEELRVYMAKISVEAYNLSLNREQSALRESCATALYKEGVANSFNGAAGTVEARRNQSVIDTMDKQAVSILYTTVSDLFKAKVDEAHRLASTLSNILISRAAEAKLQYSPRSQDSGYYNNPAQALEDWQNNINEQNNNVPF